MQLAHSYFHVCDRVGNAPYCRTLHHANGELATGACRNAKCPGGHAPWRPNMVPLIIFMLRMRVLYKIVSAGALHTVMSLSAPSLSYERRGQRMRKCWARSGPPLAAPCTAALQCGGRHVPRGCHWGDVGHHSPSSHHSSWYINFARTSRATTLHERGQRTRRAARLDHLSLSLSLSLRAPQEYNKCVERLFKIFK